MFDITASNASWVVTMTLLAGAVFTPIAGRLADLYGKKRMLLISAVPLLLGSIVCAVSATFGPMIIGRGLQGLSAAMVPSGISLLHDLLPAEKVHGAIALMSALDGHRWRTRLPLAAGVAQYASWRVLFWVVAGLTLVAGILIWRVVPQPEPWPRCRLQAVSTTSGPSF